ncbi:MAG TPA: DUF1570 domain-containing protein [Planctomycetota bacterium]|nr:DUF1570 domain-containing protein [Planctomycetota bacterium]
MIALLLLSLSLQVTADQDVIQLKDGTSRSGRIVSEGKDDVVLETLIKGSKGQVVGTVKLTVLRADIVVIDRTSPEYRRQAEARSKNFGERGVRRFEALNRIVPTPVRFQGLPGWRVTGHRYVLESSADPSFVKEVALSLDEIFAAYERFFGIRRNGDKKVKVYVFADRLEYEFYNLHAADGKVSAVAYYRPSENTIAAYNLIQKEKEQLVRAEIKAYEEDIDRFRTQAQTVERQIAALMPALRQKLDDEFAELRRSIRSDDQGGKEKRLSDLELQQKQAVQDLKDGKTTAQAELQEARRRATAELEKCRRVIEHNEGVLALQNREMFETLFHESFHAYAAMYLWEGSGQKEFPRWLHEGMASYFETAIVEGALLVHGAPHPAFLRILRDKVVMRTTLPIDKVVRGGPEEFTLVHASDPGRRTDYYAHSWAIAHYLACRVSREQLEEYAADVVGGKDPVASFEKLVGRSCAQFELDLKAHLESLK